MSIVIVFYNIGLLILALLVFGILNWVHIPAGNFIDWVIGIAIFEWLLIIVTVPWNIYFEAKETIENANESQEKGIKIDHRQLNYAKIISKRALIIAIALHIFSAVALYYLAITGITPLGYLSAIAALLLTFLRPAIRTYEYLAMRLRMMRQEFQYPREDIIELRSKVEDLTTNIDRLNKELDPNIDYSWMSNQNRQTTEIRQEIANVNAKLTELIATNQLEHQTLSREAKQAISQLTVDGQFLDNIREIIRFFKTA